RFYYPDGAVWERVDPYRFLPTLGDVDLHLFNEGTHRQLWKKLGAHVRTMDGVNGVAFAVWAPNARRVSVIGDFCGWDGRVFPMRSLGSSGVWELFIPEIGPGSLYKFELLTRDGSLRVKTDPFAFKMEQFPGDASIVELEELYRWRDDGWMRGRTTRDPVRSPLSIYEVHLGSWARVPEEGSRLLTYREIAPRLVEHVQKLGFTHVELLPVMEHPFYGSWGYQVSGYFAPTSRYGTPDDLRYFVDLLHENGIGVILDWVPAHFPKDDFALRRFDGTALYEHEDPRLGEHPDWGTLIFNYGRAEVRNFLIANALYWLDEFHVDGLRVDAVASMLYRDYSRKAGQWLPNKHGGRENLEAIDFLRQFNETVQTEVRGAMTIAEESTAWPGVTTPIRDGGLGFTFKWNMGWMHDTLTYFSLDPVHRRFHQDQLTFAMLYEYSERFIMPLSHDEVVHLKGSLLAKMSGDEWQKLANLRVLLAYMFTRPGKKLMFMGTELGPWSEWSHDT
ncbi:MAG TPA: 1,4-alpha-glucan branching protein GlgB, partial [Gemmatimonadaceae bacterium]